ncbi:uncharacterized protein EV154DRAFT_247179 [Mucor mucedo]|uniref:uncharacterized protein n=1 Tax=Mucor mucedo TaxID=29922 RepID=UPI00221E6AF8|nr:uncharacterized protein EV154DRAFT_247179 [Mucor mucedo]KAI7890604.1 hypothetical protein EV154DRAFT_247179 [Mucor mucedo]
MNSTSVKTKSQQSNIAWGLDTNTLDDWLENDLKQSSLFKLQQQHQQHRSQNKCSLNNLIIHEENESIIKQEEVEMKSEPQEELQNKSVPANLIPLIKVYSLLNAIKQNEMMNKSNKHHHHNKNMMSIAPAPPSPTSSHCRTIYTDNPPKNKWGHKRITAEAKRKSNTAAARRSRLKKANLMENLETKVDSLQSNNERLRVKLAVLETEVNFASDKEQRNRQRVLDLEIQLAMAHKKLVEGYQNGE